MPRNQSKRDIGALATNVVEAALLALKDRRPPRPFEKSNALNTWLEENFKLQSKLESIKFEPLRKRIHSDGNHLLVEVGGIQTERYAKYETRGEVKYLVGLKVDGRAAEIVSFQVHLLDTTNDHNIGYTQPTRILPFDVQWTWDGNKAAKYSADYALNPNAAYRMYDVDCTNFGSQCLSAGGKTEVGSIIDRDKDDVWFYGSFEATTSYTWAAAQNLFQHLTGHTDTQSVNDHLSLRVGDLIILEPKPGHSWHVMAVTERTDDDALMSYHTKNTLRRSFNQILANDVAAKQFWYLKIGTTYTAMMA